MTASKTSLRNYQPKPSPARHTYRLTDCNTITLADLDLLRAYAQHRANRHASGNGPTFAVTGGTPCLRSFISCALRRDGLIVQQRARATDAPSLERPCLSLTCSTCSSLPTSVTTPKAELPDLLELMHQQKRRRMQRRTRTANRRTAAARRDRKARTPYLWDQQ